MKIVIPGGSGQVGTILSRALHSDGHEVVVLTRRQVYTKKGSDPFLGGQPWREVRWDGATLGDWTTELEGSDVVLNLSGKSVHCRYTARNRQLILQSRVTPTRILGEAIGRARRPPRVWLQASTATIYAHRYDAPNDEISGVIGGDEPDAPRSWRFSIDVARAWEHAFNDAVVPHTRKVALRSAMTLSEDRGGIFDTLLGLVRRGLGGIAGDGRQFISWIHFDDFVRQVLADKGIAAFVLIIDRRSRIAMRDILFGDMSASGVDYAQSRLSA